MVAKKPAKKQSACSSPFQTLISSIRSPKGPKSERMKSLYSLLVNLCSKEREWVCNCHAPSNFLSVEFKIKFKDIHDISGVLFEKLDAKFEEFFSALSDVSTSQARRKSIFHPDVNAAIEEMTLLLRCCIVIVALLGGFDDKVVVEKGLVLLSLLRKLLSVELSKGSWKISEDIQKSFSYKSVLFDDGCTTSVVEDVVSSISLLQPSDPFHALLCALLEVFADELLTHQSVRQCLLLVDSFFSPTEMMSVTPFRHSNIGCVLEVVSALLILSVSDEQAFESLLSKLFWQRNSYFRIPEMNLSTALSLLFNPIIISAPKYIQAYIILLVSDVIGVSTSYKHIIPNAGLVDVYLSAFQGSVVWYKRHMSNFHMDGHPVVGDDPFVKSSNMAGKMEKDFESCLLSSTKRKINHHITNLDALWNLYLSNTSSRTKSELVTASIAYVKEILEVSDETFRDEILSILGCIILRASSDDVDRFLLFGREDRSPQDIILLASILKFMSCTMFQVIRCLTTAGISGASKTLKDISPCEEYCIMEATFNCFQQFNIHLPIQKFLSDAMENQPMKHEKSKWMLFHVSGLLALGYVSGLSFLVKDCLFTLMILLNLFIFEEGNLGALRPLLRSKSSSSKKKSHANVGEPVQKFAATVADRKRSQAVALKYQKIWTLYLGTCSASTRDKRTHDEQPGLTDNSPDMDHIESAFGIEENIGGASNGENFLKCAVPGSEKLSDYDDLLDFIEGKEGKDYSDWMKSRDKFHQKWKCERRAKLRWKRKEMISKNLQKRL